MQRKGDPGDLIEARFWLENAVQTAGTSNYYDFYNKRYSRYMVNMLLYKIYSDKKSELHNEELAVQCLIKLASDVNSDIFWKCKLGLYYLSENSQNVEKGIELLIEAGAKNFASAFVALGAYYESAEDYEKAYEWYRK